MKRFVKILDDHAYGDERVAKRMMDNRARKRQLSRETMGEKGGRESSTTSPPPTILSKRTKRKSKMMAEQAMKEINKKPIAKKKSSPPAVKKPSTKDKQKKETKTKTKTRSKEKKKKRKKTEVARRVVEEESETEDEDEDDSIEDDDNSEDEEVDEDESPQEEYATKEMKRLLKQAFQDYQILHIQGLRKGSCYANPDLCTPTKDRMSLSEARHHFGPVQLLTLMQTKLCNGPFCRNQRQQKKRLGMFFLRNTTNNDDEENEDYESHGSDGSSSISTICCYCIEHDAQIRKRICCEGQWTAKEAQNLLRMPGLASVVNQNYLNYDQYHRGEPWMNSICRAKIITENSNSFKGYDEEITELFSPWTITMTALTMTSIWNMFYELLQIGEKLDNTL